MSLEKFIEKGEVKTFRTTDHRFVSSLAVQIVGRSDKKALIIDGSAKIDPYWMVKVCKKHNIDESKVMNRIILGRGFTAYQLKDMVEQAGKMVHDDDSIIFVGLIDLSSRFLEDLEGEEGTWLRGNCIRKLKRFVSEGDIYCVVADPFVDIFKTDHRGDKYRKKCTNIS